MKLKALLCSEWIVTKLLGPPQRGLVHSAFSSAANLLCADGSLLSLNASSIQRPAGSGLELLPVNGLLLSAPAGTWPFTALTAGQLVILGAGWLVLETPACSLDLRFCPRWNPHIVPVSSLDSRLVQRNARHLATLSQARRPAQALSLLPETGAPETSPLVLADRLCGRGPGLTPAGDDFLAGWLSIGWLLCPADPAFQALCQHISELAEQRTHLLSAHWLSAAAAGAVALPIHTLLAALSVPDPAELERAAESVLALGATSGYDLVQGILYGLEQFSGFCGFLAARQ